MVRKQILVIISILLVCALLLAACAPTSIFGTLFKAVREAGQAQATPMPVPPAEDREPESTQNPADTLPSAGAICMDEVQTQEFIGTVVEGLATYLWWYQGEYTADTFLYPDYVGNFLTLGTLERLIKEGKVESMPITNDNGFEVGAVTSEGAVIDLLADMFGREQALAAKYRTYGDFYKNLIGRDGLFEDGYYSLTFSDGPSARVVEPAALKTIAAQDGDTLEFVCSMSSAKSEDVEELELYLEIAKDPDSKFGCVITKFGLCDYEEQYVVPNVMAFDENGFVFADSSDRLLNDLDINYVMTYAADPMEMLGFARNEIFARHGNEFANAKYANHYTKYAWYNELPKRKVDGNELNEVEQANVKLIQDWEKILG